MKAIAIITARGGSKRIPKKNIRLFCGKPIISYSINAARDSGVFDTIMVSTDSKEIADVAKSYGAEVPFYRSAETADDYATTADVLKEVLKEYAMRGQCFDYACCIYPTAPFVTGELLKNALEKAAIDNSDCVIPLVEYSYPPQRGYCIRNGYAKYINPEYARTRSQDLEPIYHDCGQYYAFSVEKFLKTEKLGNGVISPVITDQAYVQDIDNESDWKVAELKYLLMKFVNNNETDVLMKEMKRLLKI